MEKLDKQGFHYDKKKLFELITKAVTNTSQYLLKETKSTTKAIEERDESNAHLIHLKLINRNGVFDSSLIRPIEKPLVPTKKSTSVI